MAAMPLTTLIVALVLAGGGGSADPLTWDGLSLRRFADAEARLAFPVPLTQALVESRHFPDATPAQMKEVLVVSGKDGTLVELGVYDDPQRRPLADFVKATLPFLLEPGTTRMPWLATAERVPALLFEMPRTGQTFARRAAVFRVGTRVVHVTLSNTEDRAAVAVFEAIVAQAEVSP